MDCLNFKFHITDWKICVIDTSYIICLSWVEALSQYCACKHSQCGLWAATMIRSLPPGSSGSIMSEVPCWRAPSPRSRQIRCCSFHSSPPGFLLEPVQTSNQTYFHFSKPLVDCVTDPHRPGWTVFWKIALWRESVRVPLRVWGAFVFYF